MRIRLDQNAKISHRQRVFCRQIGRIPEGRLAGKQYPESDQNTALMNISAGAFSKDSRWVSTLKPEFP